MTIDGAEVTFSHLSPMVRKVAIELRHSKKLVDVSFEFSCHCYTRELLEGEAVPIAHRLQDGSVHKPRFRVFDEQRFELSKDLVGHIDALIKNNEIVTQSRKENFFRIERVEAAENGATTTIQYFIFMHARIVQEPSRPKSIKVFVESAYPEKKGIPHPGGRASRTFGRMLGEQWEAQKG